LTPHRVKSSQDELNTADVCKPDRDDVETGMKECGVANSCPSRTTDPFSPVSSLQIYLENHQQLHQKQLQVTHLTLPSLRSTIHKQYEYNWNICSSAPMLLVKWQERSERVLP